MLPSNPLSRTAATTCVLLLATAPAAFAQTSSARSAAKYAVFPASARQEADPLEALKRRSPERRWKEINERYADLATPQTGKRVRPAAAATAAKPADLLPGGVERARVEKPASAGVRPPMVAAFQDSRPAVRQPAPLELVPTSVFAQQDSDEGSDLDRKLERELKDLERELDDLRKDGGKDSEKTETPSARSTELKRIVDILPFADYQPDSEDANGDPCAYLCPRPYGLPCKEYDYDEDVPACPEEIALGGGPWAGRCYPDSMFAWAASNLYHYPLYFEDPALERYGHTYPCVVQPFVSVGRFSTQLVGLPYQMTIDPVCKKKYALGWYRPGECAPKLCYQIPFNAKAAAVEGAFITGMFYLIP